MAATESVDAAASGIHLLFHGSVALVLRIHGPNASFAAAQTHTVRDSAEHGHLLALVHDEDRAIAILSTRLSPTAISARGDFATHEVSLGEADGVSASLLGINNLTEKWMNRPLLLVSALGVSSGTAEAELWINGSDVSIEDGPVYGEARAEPASNWTVRQEALVHARVRDAATVTFDKSLHWTNSHATWIAYVGTGFNLAGEVSHAAWSLRNPNETWTNEQTVVGPARIQPSSDLNRFFHILSNEHDWELTIERRIINERISDALLVVDTPLPSAWQQLATRVVF